jgi:hypothetical protein
MAGSSCSTAAITSTSPTTAWQVFSPGRPLPRRLTHKRPPLMDAASQSSLETKRRQHDLAAEPGPCRARHDAPFSERVTVCRRRPGRDLTDLGARPDSAFCTKGRRAEPRAERLFAPNGLRLLMAHHHADGCWKADPGDRARLSVGRSSRRRQEDALYPPVCAGQAGPRSRPYRSAPRPRSGAPNRRSARPEPVPEYVGPSRPRRPPSAGLGHPPRQI